MPIVLQRVVIVPGAGMLADYSAFLSGGFVPRKLIYSAICRELIWSGMWILMFDMSIARMYFGICRELIWSGIWTGLLMLSMSIIARRVFMSGLWSFDMILEPTAH